MHLAIISLLVPLFFVAATVSAGGTRQAPGADFQLLVAGGLVSGDDEALLGDVEVLNLSAGIVVPCFKPAPLPQPLYRHAGAYFSGAPTMCGGAMAGVQDPDTGANVAQKYCFQYAFGLGGLIDRWDVAEDRMELPRISPAGSLVRVIIISYKYDDVPVHTTQAGLVQLADGEWWITGGENGPTSSEKFVERLSAGSEVAPDLPDPGKEDHNVVRIDDDTAFVTNGVDVASWIYSRTDADDVGTFDRVEDQREMRQDNRSVIFRV